MSSSVSTLLCRATLQKSSATCLSIKSITRFNQSKRFSWTQERHSIDKNAVTNFFDQQRFGSAAAVSHAFPGVLTKQQAKDLAVRLTPDEREVLITALQECQSQKLKAEYVVEKVPSPSRQDLLRVSVANAIPFIGFGFLDNSIMIIAGDSIEATLGAFITLSTMAAAAFGNTISDILGIGSAYYVELFAQKIGFEQPKLTPLQLDLPKSRFAANMGRVIGVTVGCLLGMLPLLFLHCDPKDEKDEKKEEKQDDKKK
ncbi:transmembrane protein 65 isoform X3 [Phymastichus coffea]|uniref:transmembrane protein 65 isoform X3 n=1 Tax=Phymastichus coffea TaxID=108790 RepID=UPI00273AF24A|nr:transmembrane protein 65 isoform X3 [Phymastichus coffea]